MNATIKILPWLLVIAACPVLGRAVPAEEPLHRRRCPSQRAAAGDPLDPYSRLLEGPRSDLVESPGRFCGLDDDQLLKNLQKQRIETIRYNTGGSSISMRLELRGHFRALFKPSQENENTVPRKEILAYRMNRLLGLSRVPPTTTLAIPTRRFHRTMKDGKVLRDRILEESTVYDKKLRGSVSWWIPRVTVVPLEKIRARKQWTPLLHPRAPLSPSSFELLGQISRMLTFDLLINNQDRFSGANILATVDGNRLYFMDNALSFFPDTTSSRRSRARREFSRLRRFSRLLYNRLQNLNRDQVAAELAKENNMAWHFLITKPELRGLFQRRDLILTRMNEMVIRHGWDGAMVFP